MAVAANKVARDYTTKLSEEFRRKMEVQRDRDEFGRTSARGRRDSMESRTVNKQNVASDAYQAKLRLRKVYEKQSDHVLLENLKTERPRHFVGDFFDVMIKRWERLSQKAGHERTELGKLRVLTRNQIIDFLLKD